MATPVCTIDELGISSPTYVAVKTYLEDQFKGIYGQDIVIDPDSQDGQLIAIFATAIHDANSMAVAVYNAFSPIYAQGVGLSSVVKINGITRSVATNSSADVAIIGQAGTIIKDGKVSDAVGNYWSLPASVTVPLSGTVTVTATCDVEGAISAGAGELSTIATPTRGWQSVSNPLAAVEGNPVEKDAALRRRQKTSVAIPSLTVLEGIIGAVANLDGVERYKAYENDQDSTDSNGIPSHSICLVVQGGDATEIATTIAAKKTPGCGTFGSTSTTLTDSYGVAHVIRFSRPIEVPVSVKVTLTPKSGYTTNVASSIVSAVADYVNGLDIGQSVFRTRLYVPANLSNGSDSATFELVSVEISRDGVPVAPADVSIAFDEAATTDSSLITIVTG